MKSKTSFINRGVLLNDFKRFSWIGIVYLLGLLCSIPLRILMVYSKPEECKTYYDAHTYLNIFHFENLQFILILVVPIFAAIFLFRYLQENKAVDMHHALPVKRETLFNTHVLAGIIFLFLPLIITALVSWALVAGLGIDTVHITDILNWLGVSLLFNLLFFMTSAAIGIFTGMSTLQGILSYIFLFLPAGLSWLLLDNLEHYVFGLATGYHNIAVEDLSPLIRLAELSRNPLQPVELAVYLLAAAALYFLGRYFYQRRHLETAGNAITFNVLNPVFKYGVTFCTMILVGTCFYHDQGSIGWTYFGYFLGAILAYFLMEILLKKSLKVFHAKNFRNFGIYTAVIILLMVFLQFDCSGYERRLPQLSQVKSIYMDSSFYPLIHQEYYQAEMMMEYGLTYEYRQPLPAIFQEENNLKNIYALHQAIVANRAEEKANLRNTRSSGIYEEICFAYELKNGKPFYRQYRVERNKYKKWLKPIYESAEYKKLHYDIFKVDPAEVNLMAINADEINKQVLITDPDQLDQAVAALRWDIMKQSYEEMTGAKRPWGDVKITLKNEASISTAWEKHYINFEELLKMTGKYEDARTMPDDLEYASIDRYSSDEKNIEYKTKTDEELADKPGILKITDPVKLEWCLRNYQNRQSDQISGYKIIFMAKKGGSFGGFVPEANAPKFITEHFSM